MWKNDSCGTVIYMGDIQEPERMNNTCMQEQWKMVSLYIIYTAGNMNDMKHNLWTEKHGTYISVNRELSNRKSILNMTFLMQLLLYNSQYKLSNLCIQGTFSKITDIIIECGVEVIFVEEQET
jgi:hypothetical protein